MRAVLQRVRSASVDVDGKRIARIGGGFLILLGIEKGDGVEDLDFMVRKTLELRIFADEEGRMNRSLEDVGGSALVVSQFTLLANVRKGRRPSFDRAAPPDQAREMVRAFCDRLRGQTILTRSGIFGAHMIVELVNDGPVTLCLDSRGTSV